MAIRKILSSGWKWEEDIKKSIKSKIEDMKTKLSKDFDVNSETTLRQEPTFSHPTMVPISMFETFKSSI